MFLAMIIGKTSNLCIKKMVRRKHVDLLLVGEEGKRHYVLIKDFNTFMYDHALPRRRRNFCRYCLQAFKTFFSLLFTSF